jgi:hypothetical protein
METVDVTVGGSGPGQGRCVDFEDVTRGEELPELRQQFRAQLQITEGRCGLPVLHD